MINAAETKAKPRIVPRRVVYFSDTAEAKLVDRAAAADELSASTFMRRIVLREARKVLALKGKK